MTTPLGLSAQELNIVGDILGARLPDQTRVWVFGSRAAGTPKPWSDLDLAIEADEPLPLPLLAELAEAFDDSPLPWKVDIVDYRTVSEGFGTIIDSTKIPFVRA